jgi:hypothetical protein
MATAEEKYFIRAEHETEWTEVTKEDFVAKERSVGFNNQLGEPDEPATSAFYSSGWYGSTRRTVKEGEDVEG